jgi:hypothetical protein
VDNLITSTYDAASDTLRLAAGAADGGVALFPVVGQAGFGPPTAKLTGSHTAVRAPQP